MKIASIIIVTVLLLVSASSSWATRTPQHSASGVIQSIDVTTQTFTVAIKDNNQQLVFVWKDYSRLIQSGRRVCFGVLKPGQTIKISYRRDIGQLVPYWAYLPKDAEARCECCTNQS